MEAKRRRTRRRAESATATDTTANCGRQSALDPALALELVVATMEADIAEGLPDNLTARFPILAGEIRARIPARDLARLEKPRLLGGHGGASGRDPFVDAHDPETDLDPDLEAGVDVHEEIEAATQAEVDAEVDAETDGEIASVADLAPGTRATIEGAGGGIIDSPAGGLAGGVPDGEMDGEADGDRACGAGTHDAPGHGHALHGARAGAHGKALAGGRADRCADSSGADSSSGVSTPSTPFAWNCLAVRWAQRTRNLDLATMDLPALAGLVLGCRPSEDADA